MARCYTLCASTCIKLVWVIFFFFLTESTKVLRGAVIVLTLARGLAYLWRGISMTIHLIYIHYSTSFLAKVVVISAETEPFDRMVCGAGARTHTHRLSLYQSICFPFFLQNSLSLFLSLFLCLSQMLWMLYPDSALQFKGTTGEKVQFIHRLHLHVLDTLWHQERQQIPHLRQINYIYRTIISITAYGKGKAKKTRWERAGK